MPNVENIWQPETQFCNWLSASFLLMTMSLLFYHMTRVQSLEMSRLFASIFSVSLISMAVIITLLSMITYYTRLTELLNDEPTWTSSEKRENIFRYIYVVIGTLITVIELSICIVMIRGVFRMPLI